MASTSYHAKPPYHRPMNYNINMPPRSKTPGPKPVSDQFRGAELPERARTPLPHEEDARFGYHGGTRTTATNTSAAQFVDHDQPKLHHAHTRAGHGRSHTVPLPSPSPTGVESTWKDASHDADIKAQDYQHRDQHQRLQVWDELAFDFDFQVRVWMMQEEMHRIAAAREAERTRLVQEEVRRTQARLLLKREFERLRILEEFRLGHVEDERERPRRQPKATAENRSVANAWAIYERNWAAISSSSEPLSFVTIPWPTLNRPSGPSSITLSAVSSFLLSEAHSPSLKPKERIKEALRRWHPDRFVRFLCRVPLEERGRVEEAVGIVARCLNELLSKYSD